MATLTKSEIAALTVDERFALVDDIYESFRGSEQDLAVPEWHREILDEILDEEEQNPQPTVSWDEARAELVKQWLP
jgi:putative addiction module component (TIGR02574 family)